MNWIYIFIGGGFGSLLRYSISLYATRFIIQFPIATLISNFLASFLVAVFTFLLVKKFDSSWLHPLLVIGFCGGFSTFSTFSLETANLIHTGNFALAILNIFLSVAICTGIIFFINK